MQKVEAEADEGTLAAQKVRRSLSRKVRSRDAYDDTQRLIHAMVFHLIKGNYFSIPCIRP